MATILRLTEQLAKSETRVELTIPQAPVVGTPTAAPAGPPVGTAENPLPINLIAKQVDAKADVMNVSKDGPQPDGS